MLVRSFADVSKNGHLRFLASISPSPFDTSLLSAMSDCEGINTYYYGSRSEGIHCLVVSDYEGTYRVCIMCQEVRLYGVLWCQIEGHLEGCICVKGNARLCCQIVREPTGFRDDIVSDRRVCTVPMPYCLWCQIERDKGMHCVYDVMIDCEQPRYYYYYARPHIGREGGEKLAYILSKTTLIAPLKTALNIPCFLPVLLVHASLYPSLS